MPTREQHDDVYDIAYRLSTLSETDPCKSFEERVAWNVWQLERLLMFASSPAFVEGTSQWNLTTLRASAPMLDPNHKQERAMAVRSIMTARVKKMNLYKFDRDGVIEAVFANDREQLTDVLGSVCGTIVEVANDCDLTLAQYLAEWREMAPDEQFSVPGYVTHGVVETRSVAEWIAEVGAYGPGLFTTTEAGPG